jgi:hypothetical protein
VRSARICKPPNAMPKGPPEGNGPDAVAADVRDRPPPLITKFWRFLFKPDDGWTDRFGFAWPLGELDGVGPYNLCFHSCTVLSVLNKLLKLGQQMPVHRRKQCT